MNADLGRPSRFCLHLRKDSQGYYYDRPRTSYEGNDYVSRSWPDGHPRRIEHVNRYRQVLNYQIPNDSLVRSVFHWPALTEFVRSVLGFDSMYTSACPISH